MTTPDPEHTHSRVLCGDLNYVYGHTRTQLPLRRPEEDGDQTDPVETSVSTPTGHTDVLFRGPGPRPEVCVLQEPGDVCDEHSPPTTYLSLLPWKVLLPPAPLVGVASRPSWFLLGPSRDRDLFGERKTNESSCCNVLKDGPSPYSSPLPPRVGTPFGSDFSSGAGTDEWVFRFVSPRSRVEGRPVLVLTSTRTTGGPP